MIRAVLDTNVLISTALPGSRLGALAAAWRERRCRLLISSDILDEYLRVLTYPKFHLTTDDVQRIVERDLLPYAETVTVVSVIRAVAQDPSDDKFLACSVDGRAEWLVTGDRHLLALNTFRGIRIAPPAEFLRALNIS